MQNVNNFKNSLQFVLKWEGGYVDDPTDPGGATKWGITERVYQAHFPGANITDITPEQASNIYASDYWDRCGCDDLPNPYNTVVFDTAVNEGPNRALDWLRKAADVANYMNFRKMYYLAIVNNKPDMRKFLAGWLNRLGDLQKFVDIVLQQQKDEQQSHWGSLG